VLGKSCWESHSQGFFQAQGLSSVSQLLENLYSHLRGNALSLEDNVDPGTEKRKLLMESAGIASFDLRDVVEILRWHEIRLGMLNAQVNELPLTSERLGLGQVASKPSGSSGSAKFTDKITGLTGYSCTGSWMIGLFRTTQSPGLSSKYIEEICSLENAHERAKLGAGLPARKDFYDFYGSEPTTYAEYLTWREFYRAVGCRARRRERSVCSFVPVSRITEIVYEEIRTSLSFAERQRLERSRGCGDEASREEAMIKWARQSMRAILQRSAALMKEGLESAKERHERHPAYRADCPHPSYCADCPHPDKCESLLRVNDVIVD